MKQYRIDPSKGLEFGIYTLGDHLPNPLTGERISAQERVQEIAQMLSGSDVSEAALANAKELLRI